MNLARFPEICRKIVAVGRNYKKHVAEMQEEIPKEPVMFLKPPSAFVLQGQPIRIPKGCENFQHEAEMAVIIGKKGRDINESEAMEYVAGYTIALDMTARDWQNFAKKSQLPWFKSKGFDTSCPIGSFVPKEKIGDINNLRIWCSVNGKIKQDANTSEMIFKVPFIISHVSSFITFEPGDLILTGTPEGISPVKPGDIINAGLDDIVQISFKVTQ